VRRDYIDETRSILSPYFVVLGREVTLDLAPLLELGTGPLTDKCWVFKASQANNAAKVRFVSNLVCLEAMMQETQANPDENWLVQQVVPNPLLYEGKKFHIRCNVLSVGRLYVFVHNDMVLHICSENYQEGDWENAYVHISNHVVQQNHPSYSPDTNQSSLEKLEQILDQSQGEKTNAAAKIRRNVSRAVAAVFDAMLYNGRKKDFFPVPDSFELFGFDFLVQDLPGLPVKLLEINNGPALEGHESMHQSVKCRAIVQDTLAVVLDQWVAGDGTLSNDLFNAPIPQARGGYQLAYTYKDSQFLSPRYRAYLKRIFASEV